MSATRLLWGLLLLSDLALGGGCQRKRLQAAEETPRAEVSDFTDTSPHLAEFVDVNGVRLNYLDWGGHGSPLVLLHGIGDDPHIFDDLAPLFRKDFHVLGYARRGHGDSDAPAKGRYDLQTLVVDLRGLLDALRIERANLLGWGMGGNEITRFAGDSPERVDKLVYLDAAYDWSDAAFLPELFKMMTASSPSAADTASLDAYRLWYQSAWLGDAPWTDGLEAYLRDTIWVARDGHVTPRMSENVAKKMFASLSAPPRDYKRVTAPALALYATTFFPEDPTNPARAREARDFERNVMAPFRRDSRDRVVRELRGATLRELPGTTHLSSGARDVEALASTIRDFLLTSEPAPVATPAPERVP